MDSALPPEREITKPSLRFVSELYAELACRECGHNEDVHTDWRTDDAVCRCGCSDYVPINRVLNEIDEVWLETRLDAWIIAQRLVLKQNYPVIAEVRIFPAVPSGRPKAGRWVPDMEVYPTVPRGGVSARLLRRVTLGTRLKLGPRALERLRARLRSPNQEDIEAPDPLRTPRAPSKASRLGRPALEETFYVMVAKHYVAAVNRDPRRFLDRMAHQLHLTAQRVRGYVHQARARGLLTSPGKQGMVGGELTPKAHALLSKVKKRGSRGRSKLTLVRSRQAKPRKGGR